MNFKILALTVLAFSVAGCQSQGVVTRTNGGSFVIKNGQTTVASGQRTKLFFNHAINPDCSSATIPSIRIVDEPKHGRITIVGGTDYVYFPATNPRSACNSKRVAGQYVYYTSDLNFVGDDTFTYEWYPATGGAVHVNATMHVR